MKLLRENYKVLILVIFTQITEVLHLFFDAYYPDQIFDTDIVNGKEYIIYFADVVYFICEKWANMNVLCMLIIFSLIPKEKRVSKSISFAMVIISFIEFIRQLIYANNPDSITMFSIDNMFINELVYLNSTIIFSIVLYNYKHLLKLLIKYLRSMRK